MSRAVRSNKGGPGTTWVVRAVVLATAMAVFFLVLGRGGTTAGHDSSGRRDPGQNQPLQDGKPPPDISAVSFDGRPFRLASLHGKVVLVNFFASWCAECRAEIPDIQATYQAKRMNGFEVVGVNAWENGDGQSFLRQLGGTYPAVADPQPASNRPGPIANSYGLDTQALPVSVFVARDGKVHRVYPGRIDRQTIDAELKQLGLT